MPQVNVSFYENDNSPIWPEVTKGVFLEDPAIYVGRLREGMKSGGAAVWLRVDIPDGTTIIAQTSQKAFLAAADMLRARTTAEQEGLL